MLHIRLSVELYATQKTVSWAYWQSTKFSKQSSVDVSHPNDAKGYPSHRVLLLSAGQGTHLSSTLTNTAADNLLAQACSGDTLPVTITSRSRQVIQTDLPRCTHIEQKLFIQQWVLSKEEEMYQSNRWTHTIQFASILAQIVLLPPSPNYEVHKHNFFFL